MKFLITGINGQLGYDVKLELENRGFTKIIAPTRDEMDFSSEEAVRRVMLRERPDVIIHCGAYTAVDKAEIEKEKCYDVNVNGTKYIAKWANEVEAKVVYISTDYVFNGELDSEYQVDDKIEPVNYYGKTKYLGEEEIKKCNDYIIVRISWVFGKNGKNFVKTMLDLAKIKDEINVVDDQVGSPTYTKDLAQALVDMALSDIKGTYHITNEGFCSWYEFAKYIFEVNGIDIKVNPIKTCDYKTVAKRPLNSKLSKEKLETVGVNKLPHWEDAVKRYSVELKKEGM